MQAPIIVGRKGSVTEDSGIDLTFGECERMDKLKDTKTELSLMILMPWTILKTDFYTLLHVFRLLVSITTILYSHLPPIQNLIWLD